MNYRKEIIKRFILGAPFGLVLTTLLTVFVATGSKTVTFESRAYIVSVIVTLLIGGYLSAISVVYDVDRWGLHKQTSIHLLLVTPFFPVAYFLGWLPRTAGGIVVYLLIWLVIYGILWNIIRLYVKHMAKELNDGVKAFQRNE